MKEYIFIHENDEHIKLVVLAKTVVQAQALIANVVYNHSEWKLTCEVVRITHK